MMKKLFAAVLMLALCMAVLPGASTNLDHAANAEIASLSAEKPEYKITIDGLKGTVTRVNNTSKIYEDMYIRYAVNYIINDEAFLMIDLMDVRWDKTQVGVVGTFSLPKIQIAGEATNTCYMLTTDELAYQKPITDVIPNTYGLLIQ